MRSVLIVCFYLVLILCNVQAIEIKDTTVYKWKSISLGGVKNDYFSYEILEDILFCNTVNKDKTSKVYQFNFYKSINEEDWDLIFQLDSIDGYSDCDVFLFDSVSYYIKRNDSVIYFTHDAGATWDSQTSSKYFAFFDIYREDAEGRKFKVIGDSIVYYKLDETEGVIVTEIIDTKIRELKPNLDLVLKSFSSIWYDKKIIYARYSTDGYDSHIYKRNFELDSEWEEVLSSKDEDEYVSLYPFQSKVYIQEKYENDDKYKISYSEDGSNFNYIYESDFPIFFKEDSHGNTYFVNEGAVYYLNSDNSFSKYEVEDFTTQGKAPRYIISNDQFYYSVFGSSNFYKTTAPVSVVSLDYENIKIYVSNDQLHFISNLVTPNARISIYDLAGRKVFEDTKTLYSGENIIDVSTLGNRGFYQIIITDGFGKVIAGKKIMRRG